MRNNAQSARGFLTEGRIGRIRYLRTSERGFCDAFSSDAGGVRLVYEYEATFSDAGYTMKKVQCAWIQEQR